ncbi:MAG: succinate dehydrogenase cytochrome b subunit, partial [Bacteroidota bacterium]
VYQNRRARPVSYAYNKPQANSMWASRNMGLLGTIILVFIVTHMANFWFRMHWGPIGTDPAGNKDLWTVVYAFFQSPGTGLWFTLFYVLGMAALGFHLFHGFQSAFQSLGVRHERYTPVIKFLGYGLSIVFPLFFAAIPVFIYASGINS